MLLIAFRIRDEAPAGGAVLNLRQSFGGTITQLNEGGLDLIPDPSDEEGDLLDGRITVLGTEKSLPTDAFHLVGPRGALRLHAEAMLGATGMATIVRPTFAGRRVTAGSRADGLYTLTIEGDRIIDASGTTVDGAGDRVAGGDAVEKFFRLHGHSDGDRDVEDSDLDILVGTLGKQLVTDVFRGTRAQLPPPIDDIETY